ncbi:MAG: hypothetical protein QM765_35570 [Myxococcales bacterium]
MATRPFSSLAAGNDLKTYLYVPAADWVKKQGSSSSAPLTVKF